METHVLPVSVKGVAVQGGKVLLLRNERDLRVAPVWGAGNRCTSVVSSITIIAGPRMAAQTEMFSVYRGGKGLGG